MSLNSRRAVPNVANSPLQRAKARLAEQSGGSSSRATRGSYYLGPAPPPLFTPPSARNKYSNGMISDIDPESIAFIDENVDDNDCKTEEMEDACLRHGGDQGANFSKDIRARNVLQDHAENVNPQLLSPAERSFAATAFEPYAPAPAWEFAETFNSVDQQEEAHEGAATFGSGLNTKGGFARRNDDNDIKNSGISASPRAEALLEALLATQTSQAAQLTALREALVHLSTTLEHLTPDLRPASCPSSPVSGLNNDINNEASDARPSHSNRPEDLPSANDEPTSSTSTNMAASGHEPTAVPEPQQTNHSEGKGSAPAEKAVQAETAVARNSEDVSSAHASATTTVVSSAADTAAAAAAALAAGYTPSEIDASAPEFSSTLSTDNEAIVCALDNHDDAKLVGGSIRAASAAELRAVGFTAQNCLASGITPREVLRVYPGSQCRAAGLTLADFRTAQTGRRQYEDAGWQLCDLMAMMTSSTGRTSSTCTGVHGGANNGHDDRSSTSNRSTSGSVNHSSSSSSSSVGVDDNSGFQPILPWELRAAGWSCHELRQAGLSASSCWAAGFSLRDFKDAGFSASELLSPSGLALAPREEEIIGASSNPSTLLPSHASSSTPARGVLSPGDRLPLTPAPLWSPPSAPFSPPAPPSSVSATVRQNNAFAEGVSGASSSASLSTVADESPASWCGSSPNELRAAGYSASELLNAGVSLEALVKEVGFLAPELLAAGVPLQKLGSAAKLGAPPLFSFPTLLSSGVPLGALRAGLTCPLYPTALSLLGCSPLACKNAGYSAEDFVAALALETGASEAVAETGLEIDTKEEKVLPPEAPSDVEAPAPSPSSGSVAQQLPFANGVVSFHQGPFEHTPGREELESSKVTPSHQLSISSPPPSRAPTLSVRLLESIGFTLAELRANGGLECGKWCKAEGYGCRELKDRGGFSATQLFRNGGFGPADLLAARFPIGACKDAGCSPSGLLEVGYPKCISCKGLGHMPSGRNRRCEMCGGNCLNEPFLHAADLPDAPGGRSNIGSGLEGWIENPVAPYPIRALRTTYGFSVRDCVAVGFSLNEIRSAGYSADEAGGAFPGLFTHEELATAGYPR